MRDTNGRFLNGHYKTPSEKMRVAESLKESWKFRDDYIGDIKGHKLYNIWRSFMFTEKGQQSDHSPEWDKYRTFYNDNIQIYEKEKRFVRVDKLLPFQKGNCIFMTDEESSNFRNNNIFIEYNGKRKTVKEWCYELNISTAAVRLRYHRHKEYTSEEVLFGKKSRKKPRNVFTKENIRASKLCSSSRIKDRRKGLETDVDMYWFMDNISGKPCTYCGSTINTGMDRIDNNIGHIKTNIVPACMTCNSVRSNLFTVEEMKIIGIVIKNIKESR